MEVVMGTETLIEERLLGSFELYTDLVETVPEDSLALKLPGMRSNTLGAQLWCVVGARESFAGAIRSGAWPGFTCSLSADETREREAVRAALSRSAEHVQAALRDADLSDDDRLRFALRLLEHEAAHQGQVIRYLYGLRLPIPARWAERYALS
jgi:hypothetical protein